jgi:hypothetical protein
LEDRLRQIEQAEQDGVQDQDRSRHPNRAVGGLLDAEPDRRQPREGAADRDEQWEEEHPHRQRVADLSPFEVEVGRSLLVRDRPLQSLSRAAARRRGVPDEALQHLPDPERGIAEPRQQDRADDQARHDPCDLFRR